MKNSKLRRVLLLLACAVLLVSLSVGATLAYLTAQTGEVKNTFSVGKVTFDREDDDDDGISNGLDEGAVYEYTENTKDTHGKHTEDYKTNRKTENIYKLVPGRTYDKDPVVHIGSDSEDAWLFVKVVNEIADIEKAGDTTIAAQMTKLGWTAIGDTAPGVYYWPTKVVAGQDVTVFNTFTIDGAVETGTKAEAAAAGQDTTGKLYLGDYVNAKITIQAYIVQADGLDTAPIAWAAAPLAAWLPATGNN